MSENTMTLENDIEKLLQPQPHIPDIHEIVTVKRIKINIEDPKSEKKNFAALLALTTQGIQTEHMKLHKKKHVPHE